MSFLIVISLWLLLASWPGQVGVFGSQLAAQKKIVFLNVVQLQFGTGGVSSIVAHDDDQLFRPLAEAQFDEVTVSLA